jgi:hypothetical protein
VQTFLFLFFLVSLVVNNGTNFDVLEETATLGPVVHLTAARVLMISFGVGLSIFVLVYASASFRCDEISNTKHTNKFVAALAVSWGAT